jgi:hydrogenase expression/formation protein HypC
MCLAIPGKIIAVHEGDSHLRTGTVDFQGSQIQAGLALVPEAGKGDWVLVHAGFAISKLSEVEARETWAYLDEAGLVGDTQDEKPEF